MTTIFDVSPNALIGETVTRLKDVSEISPPEWAAYVKTGAHKERPPVNADWWYFRSAAVLRTCARLGPIGVSKLRTKYGGKKNRGHKPGRQVRGSGNILRKVLQQLEAAKLVKQTTINKRKGRVVTPKGQALLDACAYEVVKKAPKPAPRPAPKPVKKEVKPEAPAKESLKTEAKPAAKAPAKADAKAAPVPKAPAKEAAKAEAKESTPEPATEAPAKEAAKGEAKQEAPAPKPEEAPAEPAAPKEEAAPAKE